MAEPKKLADLARNAAGTSALGPWALIRQAIGIPARNPEAAALEAEALRVMRSTANVTPLRLVEPMEELARRMRAAGAPPERVADWLGWRDTPAGGFVREWLAELERPEAPHILVLSGAAGSGKTVAALDALAWALRVKARGPAHYAPMRETVALGRYSEDGERWKDLLGARFLLVDEAVGKLDDHRKDRFDELFCARYDSGLPTVVTTNLAPPVILNKEFGHFGERVASRLGDRRACRIAECGTVDLRRHKP